MLETLIQCRKSWTWYRGRR